MVFVLIMLIILFIYYIAAQAVPEIAVVIVPAPLPPVTVAVDVLVAPVLSTQKAFPVERSVAAAHVAPSTAPAA